MAAPDDLRSTVQAILAGPWIHGARALEACKQGKWPEFVAATAPANPGLLGLLAHRACVRKAASSCSGPREVQVDLTPAWACSAEEEPENSWFRVHVYRSGDHALSVCETGPFDHEREPFLDARARVICRVNRWEVAHVALARHYSPEIPLLLRRGDFGVLAGQVDEVLEVTIVPGSPRPAPNLTVPPFCTWFEPRVDGLPEELAAALRALSITTDDEGNLVERPPPSAG